MLNILTDWHYWLKVAIIIISVHVITTLIRKMFSHFIKRQSHKINVDPTNFSFIKNSISFIAYTVGLALIFQITPQLKNLTSAIFAGAGILAAVVGFASQKAFSNIIGGIFILIFRPFRVNDIIEVGTLNKGVVEEITLRHTIIRNYENRRIIIPNTVIGDEIIVNSNLIDEKVRKFIHFNISYDSDVDLAKEIIREEAEKHPLTIDNRTPEDLENAVPKVIIRVIELGAYAITIRAYVWANKSSDAFEIQCDMNESVKKRFDTVGIEIPYPYQSLLIKQPAVNADK